MNEPKKVELRKKVYQLLKVNDATNKSSWWNLADDVVDLIQDTRDEAYAKGYSKGMTQGYVDGNKGKAKSYKKGRDEALEEMHNKLLIINTNNFKLIKNKLNSKEE